MTNFSETRIVIGFTENYFVSQYCFLLIKRPWYPQWRWRQL